MEHLYRKLIGLFYHFSWHDYPIQLKMKSSFRVFIPFIHEEFTSESIIDVLEKKQMCHVRGLNLHEKKEKQKNGTLRSMKHYYAFLEIEPYVQSVQGANLLANLIEGKNTHIMHDEDPAKYWILKPHLSVEDRIAKGISLLQSTTENHLPFSTETEHNDKSIPEWMNTDVIKPMRLKDFPHLPTVDLMKNPTLPDCLQFLTPKIMEEIARTANERRILSNSITFRENDDEDYLSLIDDINRVHRIMQIL